MLRETAQAAHRRHKARAAAADNGRQKRRDEPLLERVAPLQKERKQDQKAAALEIPVREPHRVPAGSVGFVVCRCSRSIDRTAAQRNARLSGKSGRRVLAVTAAATCAGAFGAAG
jgi:hypothetical protein